MIEGITPASASSDPQDEQSKTDGEFYFTTDKDGLVHRVSKSKEELDRATREEKQEN